MSGSRRRDPRRFPGARAAIDTSAFPTELDALLAAVTRSGVVVANSTHERLLAYAEALVAWSSRVNLVSRVELSRLVDKHLAASLVPLRVDPAGLDVTRRVLDIGSGGGLPGIVLAAARPAWDVTLLEPLRRKTLFLTAMADRLPNVHVRRERAEDAAGDRELAGACDLVTSRAVAPPDVVWPLARPFLAPGGELLVFVARDDHDAQARALAETHTDAFVSAPLHADWHRGAVMRVRVRRGDD